MMNSNHGMVITPLPQRNPLQWRLYSVYVYVCIWCLCLYIYIQFIVITYTCIFILGKVSDGCRQLKKFIWGMQLETIMLGEVKQSPSGKYVFPDLWKLIYRVQKCNIYEQNWHFQIWLLIQPLFLLLRNSCFFLFTIYWILYLV